MKGVLSSLDDDAKETMEHVMREWPQRRLGVALHDKSGYGNDESSISIPLGPGEFDEGLGLPLCVVCHHVSLSFTT